MFFFVCYIYFVFNKVPRFCLTVCFSHSLSLSFSLPLFLYFSHSCTLSLSVVCVFVLFFSSFLLNALAFISCRINLIGEVKYWNRNNYELDKLVSNLFNRSMHTFSIFLVAFNHLVKQMHCHRHVHLLQKKKTFLPTVASKLRN